MNTLPPTRFYALNALVKLLRESLLEGKWNEALPPERELAGLFQVSRSTLRKALRILEEEGLLAIRQGKPTSISIPEAIAPKRQSYQVRLVYPYSEMLDRKVPSFRYERLSNDIRARLHAAGISFRELSLSSNTARGAALIEKVEREADEMKNLWIVFYPDSKVEGWFAEIVPNTTLLIGMGAPTYEMPSVDVDQIAIGRHLGTVANQRNFRSLMVISEESCTMRGEHVTRGIRQTLSPGECHLSSVLVNLTGGLTTLPSVFTRLAGSPMSLIVVTSNAILPPVLYHLARQGLRIPLDVSLISTAGLGDLRGFGIDLAYYDDLEAKLAKSVTQQVIDVTHIDGLHFQQIAFLSEYHAGETLARHAPGL